MGFTIHPTPTDTQTLIPHLNHLEKRLGQLPENIIADAGYGSEENYEYLEEKHLVHVGNRKYVTEAGYETSRDY